jgi:hypothetical protein
MKQAGERLLLKGHYAGFNNTSNLTYGPGDLVCV